MISVAVLSALVCVPLVIATGFLTGGSSVSGLLLDVPLRSTLDPETSLGLSPQGNFTPRR